MPRTSIFDTFADGRFFEIEQRGDEALTQKFDEAFDAIEDGAGWVKRGPFRMDHPDGTSGSGWLVVVTHRRESWAITWSVVSDDVVKIHAIEPTVSL